jgi:hypothetical protein
MSCLKICFLVIVEERSSTEMIRRRRRTPSKAMFSQAVTMDEILGFVSQS